MSRGESRSAVGLLLAASLAAAGSYGQERPAPPSKTESGPAPRLPEQFRNAPRVSVAEEVPPPLPPLTVRLSSGGNAACYQARWRGDRPEAVTLRIPGDERRKLTLLQLAYDPARKTRYLFYDAGRGARGAIWSASPSGPEGTVSFALGEMELSVHEDPACENVEASAPIGQTRPWRDGDGPNAGARLARVQIFEEPNRPVWGWCLAEGYGGASTNSATRNPTGGARQEWKLYSYVPVEGESIALVLQMSADWTDPRDERVYRYFQFASGEFVPLAKEGRTAFRLDSGPAVPRPIEVRVFAEDDWAGCASRASVPKAAGVSSPNRSGLASDRDGRVIFHSRFQGSTQIPLSETRRHVRNTTAFPLVELNAGGQ